MKYKLVLGLEVHLQITTDMKMFCACKNDPFHGTVNSHVCPVCLGLPGAMPVPNKEAIEKARQMAVALGTSLRSPMLFERKNYFYPDLPKAFQITTPHYPVGEGGEYELLFQPDTSQGRISNPTSQVVRWREIHLEEDTAKSMHKDGKTLVDYNKSGVPLLEMVTEPDFETVEQAVQFCKEIQWHARYLGVSDADMEKGHMRLEANISLAPVDSKTLPNYRVELKNINSFTFMKRAVEAEITRQSAALVAGDVLEQETRGYNENTKMTFTQRSKEEAHDYRYFPEPDIPPVTFNGKENAHTKEQLPMLPRDVVSLLRAQEVRESYLPILVGDKKLADFTMSAIKLAKKKGLKADTIVGEIVNNKLKPSSISPEKLVSSILTKASSKISDEGQIATWVEQAIAENPQSVAAINAGKMAAIGAIIGAVMKLSKGKADAKIVSQLITESIQK